MIAAIDVDYKEDGSARAAAVVFSGFSDSKGYRAYVKDISQVRDYIPGQFYKRELPCIMAILEIIEEDIDTVIIDGYVDLENGAGLGLYLWRALGGKKKVIGVAKKHFRGSKGVEIFRGKSRQPLYITAVGTELLTACDLIAQMDGKYRIPSLLKQADSLSRHGVIN